MDATPIRTVFFDLGDTLVVSNTRSWIAGAKQAISDLKSQGVRIGVISNTGDLTREELAPYLPTDFDWEAFTPQCVILSSEVGYEKPHPEIFRIAIATAAPDMAAGECLFCTEDLVDTLAAQRAGMLTSRFLPPPNSDIGTLVASLDKTGIPRQM